MFAFSIFYFKEGSTARRSPSKKSVLGGKYHTNKFSKVAFRKFYVDPNLAKIMTAALQPYSKRITTGCFFEALYRSCDVEHPKASAFNQGKVIGDRSHWQ